MTVAASEGVQTLPVGIAKGDRQGVGGIQGGGRFREGEEQVHHARDLLLGRPAVPGQSALHLGRGVLQDLDPSGGEGRHEGAPGMGEDHQGPCVAAEERALENSDLRSPARHQRSGLLAQPGQPPGQRQAPRRDPAASQERRRAVVDFDHAVAGVETAGVETEDAHRNELGAYRGGGDRDPFADQQFFAGPSRREC